MATTFTSVSGSNEQTVHTFFLEFDIGVKNRTIEISIDTIWLHSCTKRLIKKIQFLADNIKSFFLTTDGKKRSDVWSS